MKTAILVCGLITALVLAGCTGDSKPSQPDFDKGATPFSIEATATPSSGAIVTPFPVVATSTPTPTLSATSPAGTAPTPTKTVIALGGPPTLASGPPSSGNPPAASTQIPTGPSPTPPAGLKTVAAPIDGVEVRTLESFPPRYVVGIKAGLPNGCAKQYSNDVVRTGDSFGITVFNSLPAINNLFCIENYVSYEVNVTLPGTFIAGQTYSVQVNDKSTTFKAQ